jgi:hypothetical protein
VPVPRFGVPNLCGADLVLIAGAAIAGSVTTQATYTQAGAALLIALVLIVSVGLVRGGTALRPHRWAIAVAYLVCIVVQAVKPPLDNVHGNTVLRVAVGFGIAATVVAAATLLRARAAVVVAAVALIGVSYALVVAGGSPIIDVWVILQQSSLAVVHGMNPYVLHFSGVPPGQTSGCFNYLPATFLLPIPGRLIGDVRWVEAASMLAAVIVLAVRVRGTARRDPRWIALALLLGVLPGALYDVQQAWNETLLLGALVIAAVLIDAGRGWWAVLPLAVGLATKQHLVLLLPLFWMWPGVGPRRTIAAVGGAAAITAPWLLLNYGRFQTCTVDFFLHIAPRGTSLSVWHWIPSAVHVPVLLVALLVGYVIVFARAPRTAGGLLIAGAVVFAFFDLVNKQTFLNQWLFVAQLIVAGLALHGARGRDPVSR